MGTIPSYANKLNQPSQNYSIKPIPFSILTERESREREKRKKEKRESEEKGVREKKWSERKGTERERENVGEIEESKGNKKREI